MNNVPLKEYWVNVYKNELGVFYPSKDLAIKYAGTYRKTLYRIHVKMKEPITTTDKDILNRIKNAETRSIRSGKRRMQKIW